jgi:hypothetical protein
MMEEWIDGKAKVQRFKDNGVLSYESAAVKRQKEEGQRIKTKGRKTGLMERGWRIRFIGNIVGSKSYKDSVVTSTI